MTIDATPGVSLHGMEVPSQRGPEIEA